MSNNVSSGCGGAVVRRVHNSTQLNSTQSVSALGVSDRQCQKWRPVEQTTPVRQFRSGGSSPRSITSRVAESPRAGATNVLDMLEHPPPPSALGLCAACCRRNTSEGMCSTMLHEQYRIGTLCIVHCKSGWLRFWVSERGRPNFKECTSARTGISIFIPGSW